MEEVRWWTVRPRRVAAGVAWGALLVAAAVVLRPLAERAWWRAELLASDAPTVLRVPVARVARDDLADTWGDPRSGGRSHQGIDIFAARRSPVLSATRGIVVRRGTNPLGGRTITILGPGGERHYYAHLQGWAGHAEGDRVAPGEVVGFVGTTGNAPADAPHLHYAVYGADGPTNPYPRLTGPAGAPASGGVGQGRSTAP